MKTRIAGAGGMALIIVAGCNGRVLVDLGGTPSAARGIDTNDSDGGGSAGSTCAYSGPYSDGSGYYSGETDSCSSASGPLHSFASTADVTTALVGWWRVCGFSGTAEGDAFLNAVDPQIIDYGIEFTSDGRFFALTADNANPGSSPPLTYGLQHGPSPLDTGVFAVVDASATLGPGKYQLRMTAANGGVFLGQVVAYDSPVKLRVFTGSGQGFEDFTRPLPWTFRSGVCGPTFGPPHTETSASDFAARLQGRWAWCSGQFGVSSNVGIEFPGDGTWHFLLEDEAGNLSRATTPGSHGTIDIPSDHESLSQSLVRINTGAYSNPGPLLLDECGRGMRFPAIAPPSPPGDGGSYDYVPQDFQRLP